MKELTYEDFKIIDSPESATPEQIELVNRACAKVDEEAFDLMDYRFDPTSRVRYVQDDNNSNRAIRKAIEKDGHQYRLELSKLLPIAAIHVIDESRREEIGLGIDLVACAPQSARLYAAYKTLEGIE